MARTRKTTDEVLLTALACGATVDNAANSAGVSPRTVHRRFKEPAFRHKLQALRADMVERTSAMLTAAGLESVKTLLFLLQGANPAGVRLGAARSILELGAKLRDVHEMAQRLAALEARLPEALEVKETSLDTAA